MSFILRTLSWFVRLIASILLWFPWLGAGVRSYLRAHTRSGDDLFVLLYRSDSTDDAFLVQTFDEVARKLGNKASFQKCDLSEHPEQAVLWNVEPERVPNFIHRWERRTFGLREESTVHIDLHAAPIGELVTSSLSFSALMASGGRPILRMLGLR